MKIYNVFHCYDEDGGYGDAIGVTDLVAVFSNEEEAEKYVEKYSKPHVYAHPYSYLYTGELYVSEGQTVFDSVDEAEPFDAGDPDEYGKYLQCMIDEYKKDGEQSWIPEDWKEDYEKYINGIPYEEPYNETCYDAEE